MIRYLYKIFLYCKCHRRVIKHLDCWPNPLLILIFIFYKFLIMIMEYKFETIPKLLFNNYYKKKVYLNISK